MWCCSSRESTFLFASPKRKVAKEKGDFWPKAPPAKKSSTLGSHSFLQLGGAGLRLSPTTIRLHQSYQLCALWGFITHIYSAKRRH